MEKTSITIDLINKLETGRKKVKNWNSMENVLKHLQTQKKKTAKA